MRIGIVNDLALAREALRRVVACAPGHTVAWLAVDGLDAITQAKKDRPDLILMDLIMPGIDGVEATRRIMAEAPCPILVVTSSVSSNVGKVFEAMGLGALDAVDTPSLTPDDRLTGSEPLVAKIGMVAKLLGKSQSPARSNGISSVAPAHRPSRRPLVAIGASTGGPSALAEVVLRMPADWTVPVVIIQHVDAAFAPGLARWLTDRTGRNVEVARAGDTPQPGHIYLAATNDHLLIESDQRFRYTDLPRELSYRPSVDVFFASLAAHWPEPWVAVLLTGMGRDGARSLLALKRNGWSTIAQDQDTSVIWGMPGAAVELGAASQVLPLSEIGDAIVAEIHRRLRHDEVTK